MRAERPSRDGRTASFADNLYPQDGQHLPYFELNPAVRRTARAGRLPLGRPATFASSLRAPGRPPRQNNAPFTGQSCQVRPTTQKVARAQPIRPRRAPPRAANASPSPRTAILRIALLALAPKPGKRLSPIYRPNPSPMLGPARCENRNRFSHPKNSRSPKHCRAVPLSLRRCRSAPERWASDGIFAHGRVFPRACAIHSISAHAEIVESLLKAWRASVLKEGTALGPRGPHVPWTGETYVSLRQPLPPFSVRALAEILFKRETRV